MKNIFTKIIIFTLCFVCALVSVGCDCNDTEEEQVEHQSIHEFEIKPTNEFLVKNGTTEYVLVIPSQTNADIKAAKEEFMYFFNMATGITLQVVSEEGLSLDENSKYISIGKTTLYNSVLESDSSKAVPYDTYGNGYKIFNVNKSVFLIGGDDLGSAYAVYKFMELTFNYESYANNCIQIDKNVKNMSLYEYNVNDIPDVKFYSKNYGVYDDAFTYDQRMFKYRMKAVRHFNDLFIAAYRIDDPNYRNNAVIGAHTALTFVPRDLYINEHPSWFSTESESTKERSQLCYTARGDAAEYNALLDAATAGIVHSMQRNTAEETPLKRIINIGNEDNQNHCNCPSCTKVRKDYGTYSALSILFLNDLIPRVLEWMEQPENAAYKRDDLAFSFIIYEQFEAAPATYNEETGKYELNNGLTLHERFVPTICSMNAVDYQQGLYSETNATQVQIYDAWSDLCDDAVIYTYSCNFRHPSYFYDSFNYFNNDFYEKIMQFNVLGFFNESQVSQRGAMTAFHSLKLYLDSKMSWNITLNMEELIDNYFDAMYKDAAATMKELFYEQRLINATANTRANYYKPRSCFITINQAKFYDLNSLLGVLDKYQIAYSQIEKYKEIDVELYNELHFHITQEWISPAVMTLEMFLNDLKVEEANALLNEYRQAGVETDIKYAKYPRITTQAYINEREEKLNAR